MRNKNQLKKQCSFNFSKQQSFHKKSHHQIFDYFNSRYLYFHFHKIYSCKYSQLQIFLISTPTLTPSVSPIMTSYAQTTIHSKNSMIEKLKGDQPAGKIIKGVRLGLSRSIGRKVRNDVYFPDADLNSIVELKPDTADVQKKMKKRISQKENSQTKDNYFKMDKLKQDPDNQFDSTVFPAIYFKKTTMRNVLKQFIFPESIRALAPTDERSPLIYQIIANLFNQIHFYVFNILVSEDPLTQSFYAFFSDSQIIPYTKCCVTPAYILIQPNLSGKILCNGQGCKHPGLAEFLINYEDGKKIWKNLTFINTAPQKDTCMKQTIAKFIKTGKYKNYCLNNLVQDTTKQVQKFFISTKNNIGQEIRKIPKQFDDTFVTNVQTQPAKALNRTAEIPLNQEQINEITDAEQKNVQFLKIKVQYMAKRQKSLRRDLAKGIIDQSKVFHKKFEMADKIDEILRKTQFSSHNSNFSFPRLVQQMKVKQQRRTANSKSVSRTFMA